MELRGSVWLVTGASGGIGRALCASLAGEGAQVIASGRDAGTLREVERATGATAIVADLVAPDEVARLAEEATAAAGRIDGLVNAAGIGWAGPFEAQPPEEIERLLAVNIAAPIRLTRALLPAMLDRRRGWIVHVASIAGHVGVQHEAVYSGTKAALIAFGEALRYEAAGRGVGVTVVAPGAVRTAFFERRGARYERRFPRQVAPERVARAVVRGIREGRAEVFVPGWMAGVPRLRGAAPSAFRRLTGRFG
jgi:short-subunit dehydrogenase